MNEKVLLKMEAGREYRRIDVRNIEVRAAEDNEMIVEGYATTFNAEYLLLDFGDWKLYEQIDRNAFDECDMSDVIFQYDHEGRVFARNRNGTLEVTPDDHGLKIVADLGGTEAGRQLYEEIKGGYTDRMSFGFVVEAHEVTYKTEGNEESAHRTITKIKKLYDVSAVSIPANDATEISARKFGEGVIAELRKEVAEAARLKVERAKAIAKAKLLGGR